MQQVKTLQSAGYELTVSNGEIKIKRPPKPLPTSLETAMFAVIKGSKAEAIKYLSSPPAPATTTQTTPPPPTQVATTMTELSALILAGDLSERDEAWYVTQWQIVASERGLIPANGSDGLPHREWAKELIKQCPV